MLSRAMNTTRNRVTTKWPPKKETLLKSADMFTPRINTIILYVPKMNAIHGNLFLYGFSASSGVYSLRASTVGILAALLAEKNTERKDSITTKATVKIIV